MSCKGKLKHRILKYGGLASRKAKPHNLKTINELLRELVEMMYGTDFLVNYENGQTIKLKYHLSNKLTKATQTFKL